METNVISAPQIVEDLRTFITSTYLFGDESRMPSDSASLLESGVLDSTGVLELIEFLEDHYHITIDDVETVPENLGSIEGLTRYVSSKVNQTGTHEQLRV